MTTMAERSAQMERERRAVRKKLLAMEAALAEANGRRRVRTLSLASLEFCVREALADDYAFRAAEVVANAYGYPAIRTACYAAKRSDGAIILAIGIGWASKGAAPKPRDCNIPQVRPDTPRVRQLAREWADTIDPSPSIILLPRPVAQAIAQSVEARITQSVAQGGLPE